MENWKMTAVGRKRIRAYIGNGLIDIVSSDYVNIIADQILDDVVADVEECADPIEWNYCDVMLAVGRVLCNRCGICV